MAKEEEDLVFLFSCNHNPAFEPALFPVYKGVNPRKRSFALMSDEASKFRVGSISIDGKNILIHKRFRQTVAQWLQEIVESGRSVYASYYSRSGRPSKKTMFIVRGMIEEAFKWHDEGKFHGNLDSLVHFGFSEASSKRWLGEAPVRVTLVPSKGAKRKLNPQEGIDYDMLLLKQGFDQVFGVGSGVNYPPYLQHWASLIGSSDWIKKKWMISNHPNFWTWKTRRNFIKQVWEMHEMGNDDLRAQIEKALKRVTGWKIWQSKVPEGTPLHNIYKDHHFAKDKAVEFLRFVRLCLHHVADTKPDGSGKPKYLDEDGHQDSFKDPKYVEMFVTETYPLFLIDLCSGLHEEGITIEFT